VPYDDRLSGLHQVFRDLDLEVGVARHGAARIEGAVSRLGRERPRRAVAC
jgi:hypothetical protein